MELPNGQKMNLFEFHHPYNDNFYWPREEVLIYARNNDYLSDGYFDRFYIYSYRGREANLKVAMLKAKEEQTIRKACRENTARRRSEAERQEATRHAAVSYRELNDIFSKM